MATVSNVLVTPKKIDTDPTRLRVTLSYTLFPSSIEKLAGSVFQATITLRGDDLFFDPVLHVASDGPFAVSATTPATGVSRSKTVVLLKSVFNEDPETTLSGSETTDEVYATVQMTYVANPPFPLPTIPLGTSPIVSGVWK